MPHHLSNDGFPSFSNIRLQKQRQGSKEEVEDAQQALESYQVQLLNIDFLVFCYTNHEVLPTMERLSHSRLSTPSFCSFSSHSTSKH